MAYMHRAAERRHNLAPGVSPGPGVWTFLRRLGQSGVNLRLQIYVLFPDGIHAQSRGAAPQSSPGRQPGAWSLDISETLRPIGRESTSTDLRFVPRWHTCTEPRSGATI